MFVQCRSACAGPADTVSRPSCLRHARCVEANIQNPRSTHAMHRGEIAAIHIQREQTRAQDYPNMGFPKSGVWIRKSAAPTFCVKPR